MLQRVLGRHYVVPTLIMAGAIGMGSWAGMRAGADELRAPAVINAPQTVDDRHPVEVYYAPAFLRELDAIFTVLGVVRAAQDRVKTTPAVEYGAGGQIILTRALPVELADGGVTRTVRTWANTISELLVEQQISVGDRDRLSLAGDHILALNEQLVITRVAISELAVNESISYKTVTQEDANRPKGKKEVVQKGKAGAKKLTYQVTRENGKEVGRKLLRTEVTAEPVEEIVLLGTRMTVLGQGKASWYKTPWGGLTAAHNTLPKGTIVEVVSLKNGNRVTVIINDRGIQTDAIIDLSVDAFKALEPLGTGVVQVRLEVAA